jgi:hypothetical protein
MSKSITGLPATLQEGKLRQFEVLARVGSVINSSLDPKDVLNRVLAKAVRLLWNVCAHPATQDTRLLKTP